MFSYVSVTPEQEQLRRFSLGRQVLRHFLLRHSMSSLHYCSVKCPVTAFSFVNPVTGEVKLLTKAVRKGWDETDGWRKTGYLTLSSFGAVVICWP